jgi:hypothetical protein
MENDKINKLDLVIEFIRKVTKEARLVKSSELYEEPISLRKEQMSDILEQLTDATDNIDIKSIKGSEELYFYSEKDMTENYAKMLARIEDKDLLEMVAETVRHESKIYPRPTDGRLFSTPPFSFGEDELSSVVNQLKDHEMYQDIQEARASNGAIYLYSEKFVTKDHAMALTEWIEVLQHETP